MNNDLRNREFVALRLQGFTLQEIADECNLTRERVRQILALYMDDEEVAQAKEAVRARRVKARVDKLLVDEIVALREKGFGVTRIGRMFGVWSKAIREALESVGYTEDRYMPPLVSKSKRFSVKDMVGALRAAESECGKPLTVSKYKDWAAGREEVPSIALIIQRLGWNSACEAAGVAHGTSPRSTYSRVSNEELVECVRKFIETTDKPTCGKYEEWSKQDDDRYSLSLLRIRLGGWREILEMAYATNR